MQTIRMENVENTTISLVNILKAIHVDLEVGTLELYDGVSGTSSTTSVGTNRPAHFVQLALRLAAERIW